MTPGGDRDGTLPEGWRRGAKLAADDGDAEDEFGGSVDLSGDGTTAVVGAPADEDPNGTEAGSAYVFSSSDGGWQQAAKLTPTDGDPRDAFGESVAVSDDGTTAVVGAVDDDPNGTDAGSAYVFASSGSGWEQAAKLTADDGDAVDAFGQSVAVASDGTTAVIGAVFDEDPNGRPGSRYNAGGSAYVFSSADGEWRQAAKLAAEDGVPGDRFGVSVAVSGDGTSALVGATGESPSGNDAGAAYVFDSSDGQWQQTATLTAADRDADDFFGTVALSDDGTTAVIGAPGDEDPNGEDAGSAYVFDYTDGAWSQETKLTASDGDAEDFFGQSVALSGDGRTAVVGVSLDEDPNGTYAGSTYVFRASDGGWQRAAKLTPTDGDPQDVFGESVAVSGDGTATVVGAPGDEDPNGTSDRYGGAGSAYVLRDHSTTDSRTTASGGSGTTATGFGPGFGAGTALAAVGIAAYRRLRTADGDRPRCRH